VVCLDRVDDVVALAVFAGNVRADQGVAPAVEHQLVEREPADLAAHRIEARQQHGLRRVVDDQIDAGDRLKGPDIAALATDDATLHLVARQVQHADDALGRLLARDALDRLHDDVSRALLGGAAGIVLDVADQEGGLALGLRLDRLDDFQPGGLGGQAGDAFEFAAA
jgi:hypothetical protein